MKRFPPIIRATLSLGLAAGLLVVAYRPATPARAQQVPATSSPPPNIVLVLTDDQRFDTLWALPNVQADLVNHGITFTNGFVSNPLCCPSRTSILTGQYSHKTKVYRDISPFGGFSTFTKKGKDQSTIATWLQAAGYRTALIGKYLNGYRHQCGVYTVPGWSRWVAFSSQNGQGEYFGYKLCIDGVLQFFGSQQTNYSTDVLANYADSFIRSTDSSQPLFLYFAPKAPHAPSTPPARYATAFSNLPPFRPPSYNEADVSDKPAYVQAIPQLTPVQQANEDAAIIDQYRTELAVDDAVGKIVQALQDTGRLSNTLFVYMSDNGLMWGEHRLTSKSVPYEESIRVPFVVRYDPMISSPRTDGHLVTNIDLAPTFAAAAGVSAPKVEGANLLPLIADPNSPWRSDFLLEHMTAFSDIPTYCGIRSTGFAYVAYATGEEELYDLTLDPYELQNVATDPAYAAALAGMRARLTVLCYPPPPGDTFVP